MPGGTAAHVAIVGGGIAGLAAAFFLRDAPVRVTVFEGSPRIGGKLAVSDVAGIPVDEGAESMLARRPEGVDLVRAVGLAGDLVGPGTTAAAIWTRGAMRPLPGGQVMGVPGDLAALARSGVLSVAGLARAGLDLVLPATGMDGDGSVAARVGSRLGAEVVDRLVEPLLGGVYAGRAAELSFEATLPGLAAATRVHRTLTGAARSVAAASAHRPAGPSPGAHRAGPGSQVFTTLAGGLGALPAAVAAASGAHVRTGASVRELRRTAAGWQLTVGSADDPEYVRADAVVLALPARPASRLLRAEVPAAAAALGGIEYASMAIVTLAFPAGAIKARPRGSGYLVPAGDGRAVKAVTFASVKWPHLLARRGTADTARAGGAGPVTDVVRCSVGRIGEEQVLQRADEDLVALARGELAAAVGAAGPTVAARVTRWGGALPQYTVGHTARVGRIRAAVADQPGLAVCGAAYDGLGIPACIATARQAAAQVLAHLARGDLPRADEGQ
ncbi:MAG TPA: protoporphyrinogen oxidase [Streptosporangiaceae bacterium]|nr:protoporphyrinogen oxidase [Streptosporangiaceae bacterium]